MPDDAIERLREDCRNDPRSAIELADLVGVTRHQIESFRMGRIESPRLSTAIQLARVLGGDITYKRPPQSANGKDRSSKDSTTAKRRQKSSE